MTNTITNEQKLNQVITNLTSRVLSGVLLKNVRLGLENKNHSTAFVNKIMRLVELEISIKGV
jgi:hypothetical protein